jgi:hypothetical protein
MIVSKYENEGFPSDLGRVEHSDATDCYFAGGLPMLGSTGLIFSSCLSLEEWDCR